MFSFEGRGGSLYSLRLRAVLKITHSADGFWLLADIAVASMEHLGVSFLSTSILGVLKPFKRNKSGFFYDEMLCNLLNKTVNIY